jgi:DNA-binding response OmpR family regulator
MMLRLLLIEDSADVRLLLEEFLLMAGFEVNAAETIAGGRQFLAGRSYDLIVTDGRLPDGTGAVFTKAERELGIPVLVITGYAHEFPQDELNRCELLQKPFRPSDLIKRINKLLVAERLKPRMDFPLGDPLSIPVPRQAAANEYVEASCRLVSACTPQSAD